MNDNHENHLPNHPKLYMWRLQDNLNDYDTGGFVKFKLYGNTKSRSVCILENNSSQNKIELRTAYLIL